MILNTTIEIYSRNERLEPGNEGIPKFTYDLYTSSRASVQPVSLSESKLQEWGLTTLAADSKHVFIPGVFQVPQAWLVKDLGTSLRYEVRGCNPWIRHTEILVSPYQGGDPV